MLPAFTAAGTQDPADLPHAHPCGARWSGATTSHCGACHETFTSVGAFDRHRNGSRCTNPEAIGMVVAPGRAYDAWTNPTTTGSGND